MRVHLLSTTNIHSCTFFLGWPSQYRSPFFAAIESIWLMAMVTVLTAAIPKLFSIFKMTQWYRQATDFPPCFFWIYQTQDLLKPLPHGCDVCAWCASVMGQGWNRWEDQLADGSFLACVDKEMLKTNTWNIDIQDEHQMLLHMEGLTWCPVPGLRVNQSFAALQVSASYWVGTNRTEIGRGFVHDLRSSDVHSWHRPTVWTTSFWMQSLLDKDFLVGVSRWPC